MKLNARVLFAPAAFLALSSCSNVDFGEALFTGLCVASEADCLKSCRRSYEEADGAFSYDGCANMCQPSGYSGCD